MILEKVLRHKRKGICVRNMSKEINISEIAQKLDISVTTVSRALSGKGRVGKKLKTEYWTTSKRMTTYQIFIDQRI